MDDINPKQEWQDFRASMLALSERTQDASVRQLASWLKRWLSERKIRRNLFEEIDPCEFIKNTKATSYFARQYVVIDLSRKMEAQYPDCRALTHLAFHLLIGSTPDFQKSPVLDFPGEYSLKAMLERSIAGKEPALSPEALLAFDMSMLPNMLGRSPVFKELYPGYSPPPRPSASRNFALQPADIERILGYIPHPSG